MRPRIGDDVWIVGCVVAVLSAVVLAVVRMSPDAATYTPVELVFRLLAGILVTLVVGGAALGMWHGMTKLLPEIIRLTVLDKRRLAESRINAVGDRGEMARIAMVPRLERIEMAAGCDGYLYRDPKTGLYWLADRDLKIVGPGNQSQLKCLGDVLPRELASQHVN